MQSYDGVAVMVGELNGLEKNKQKVTVIHKDLVVSQSCNSILGSRVIFASLGVFPAFFASLLLKNVNKLALPKNAQLDGTSNLV